MQILLTEEEYNALKNAARNAEKKVEGHLLEMCRQVADLKPSQKPYGWKEGDALVPWGCIRSARHEWYCDQCPVREVCPYTEKEWSK